MSEADHRVNGDRPLTHHSREREGGLAMEATQQQRTPRRSSTTPQQRFDSKVQRTDTCWLWTGSLDRNGYGRFRAEDVEYKAHVWAWQQIHGPKAPGMDLDHLCSSRACVRPDHLEQVTHRENLLRSSGLAARAAAATHCPQGHPYDAENTYVNPTLGHRTCRTCRRVQMIRLNDRRREANAAKGTGYGRNKRTLGRDDA